MSTRNEGLLVLAAAALLATDCAHGNGFANGTAGADNETVIEVSNKNWSDMNVYVVHGGSRKRLGMVRSFAKGVFKVPWHILTRAGQNVQLLADPIGSPNVHLSDPLVVGPGQTVEWRLENAINLSSIMIR